jgi:hypothetical protein
MGTCEAKQIADLARSDDHSNAGGETETGHRISTQIPPAVSLAKNRNQFRRKQFKESRLGVKLGG